MVVIVFVIVIVTVIVGTNFLRVGNHATLHHDELAPLLQEGHQLIQIHPLGRTSVEFGVGAVGLDDMFF